MLPPPLLLDDELLELELELVLLLDEELLLELEAVPPYEQ